MKEFLRILFCVLFVNANAFAAESYDLPTTVLRYPHLQKYLMENKREEAGTVLILDPRLLWGAPVTEYWAPEYQDATPGTTFSPIVHEVSAVLHPDTVLSVIDPSGSLLKCIPKGVYDIGFAKRLVRKYRADEQDFLLGLLDIIPKKLKGTVVKIKTEFEDLVFENGVFQEVISLQALRNGGCADDNVRMEVVKRLFRSLKKDGGRLFLDHYTALDVFIYIAGIESSSVLENTPDVIEFEDRRLVVTRIVSPIPESSENYGGLVAKRLPYAQRVSSPDIFVFEARD